MIAEKLVVNSTTQRWNPQERYYRAGSSEHKFIRRRA
jgi:hypothetical protein